MCLCGSPGVVLEPNKRGHGRTRVGDLCLLGEGYPTEIVRLENDQVYYRSCVLWRNGCNPSVGCWTRQTSTRWEECSRDFMRVNVEKGTEDLPEDVSVGGDKVMLRSPPLMKQGPLKEDNLVRTDERNRA